MKLLNTITPKSDNKYLNHIPFVTAALRAVHSALVLERHHSLFPSYNITKILENKSANFQSTPSYK